MRNFTKTLFVCSILLVGLGACSKEKRVERSLQKRSGEWKVLNYKSLQYQNGTLEEETSIASFGTMEFQKGGKMGWKINTGNFYDQYVGAWSNTESTLTMTFDNVPIEYDIIERSNKEMSLKNVRTTESQGTTYRFETTMDLERKK